LASRAGLPRGAAERAAAIVPVLRREFPRARTALAFRNPFEILVATILAAQSTDEQVNKITPALFAKFPTAAALAAADRSELEKDIHSTGFFRNKAKSLLGAAKCLVEVFGGQVPDTMEELVTLPGVARKTANIVLSAGFGKAEGIAVDTHVRRLAGRLGLSRETDPVKIERDLMAIVPRRDWLDFNSLLVDHGRKTCRARNPDCPACPVLRLCPSAFVFHPELKAKAGGKGKR
jgi:endonuclease III